MNFKVTKVEKTKAAKIFGEMETLTVATVVFDDGLTFLMSQYASEKKWFCDAITKKNGFPVISEGVGSRVTMKRAASDEMAAAIEAAL